MDRQFMKTNQPAGMDWV